MDTKSQHTPHAGHNHEGPYHAEVVVGNSNEDIASNPDKPFTDPVCGMRVAAKPERTIEYNGTDYHFCSAGCMTKFQANPQAYLAPKNAEQTPVPLAPVGTIYTCPMHPEIREPKPGNCPICGMALEPLMPSLDDEENPELVDFRRRFWWTLPLTV
ncbi:MAG: YHS domain-containing protein, partial [Sphingobacteriales bacterium]